MFITMDIKGKGPIILLLVSTLVLCQNVASHPTCLSGPRCYMTIQGINKAIYTTIQMQFDSLEVFLEFLKQYSQDPSFSYPDTRICHTANISVPTGQAEARLMQYHDIIHTVIRYLNAWNEPLMYLALEEHRLTKLHDFFTLQGDSTSEIHQELKELIKLISSQLGLEITDKVEYPSWPELQSLQSPDEKSFLSTFYNTLNCLFTDLRKIESFLQLLKCRAFPDDDCNDLPLPFVSEMVFKNSSFGKV